MQKIVKRISVLMQDQASPSCLDVTFLVFHALDSDEIKENLRKSCHNETLKVLNEAQMVIFQKLSFFLND